MYRFNGGHGAVTCDECNIIFDSGLSYQEYEENYRKNKKKKQGDYCWKHSPKKDKIQKDKA